jgi:hypothetical protein
MSETVARRSAIRTGALATIAAGLFGGTGTPPPVDAAPAPMTALTAHERAVAAALQLGRAVALLEAPAERLNVMTVAMREARRLMDLAKAQTA